MRELAILTFVSIDGVMQGVRLPEEDTTGGFTKGGWAAPYWEIVMEQVQTKAMSEPYDILLGRKTYELFSSHQASSPNRGSVYIVSSSLTDLKWDNATVIRENIVSEITRLKNQDGPLLQVHGSWQLIQSLLEANLIDEFRLWTFPVILGEGKHLFDRGLEAMKLNLVTTSPSGNGVVMNIYRKAPK